MIDAALPLYYMPHWYNFMAQFTKIYLGEENTVMETTVKALENCDLVVIKGRIDSYTAPNLSEMLSELTLNNQFKFILDMSDVSYVSSAGLRVLIDLQKTCKKMHQGEVLLLNIPQRVYETLELAGFLPLFKFYKNVDSAIAAF
jgi:anti-sigma B factor antagonist